MRKGATTLATAMLAFLATSCTPDGLIEGPTSEGGQYLPVLRGQAYAAGGGDLSGLWATWHPAGDTVVDSARVNADGTFEIHTTTPDSAGELLIDGPEPRAFHPFLYPFARDSLLHVTVVMVPRKWTIRRGIYKGQTVETSLDLVVDDDASQAAYSYYFGRPDRFVDPVRYVLDLRTWSADLLPAKVAFDHRYGSPTMTPQDSADIWGTLNRMEEIFGVDLFQPATAGPDWWPNPVTYSAADLVPGAIRLIYGGAGLDWLAGPLSSEPVLRWDQHLGNWAAGSRFSSFRVQHTYLNGGDLSIRAPLDSLRLGDGNQPWQTVLMHEMLHDLGVGHTLRIPSPQGPRMRTLEPSPYDVAYIELLREAMRVEEEQGTFLGIMPAVIGEREVLLGLPPVPDVDGKRWN